MRKIITKWMIILSSLAVIFTMLFVVVSAFIFFQDTEKSDRMLRFSIVDANEFVVYNNWINPVFFPADKRCACPDAETALKQGFGYLHTWSDTEQTMMHYFAFRTSDNEVIRISFTDSQINKITFSFFLTLLICLLAVGMLITCSSIIVTRRILSPLNKIKFHENIRNEIKDIWKKYPEIAPIIDKVHAQAVDQSRFSSSVAHELKTPISIIKDNVYYLKKITSLEENGDMNEALDLIGKMSIDMTNIVEKLLFLSKLNDKSTVLEYEKFNVYEALFAIVKNQQNKITAKNIDLTISIPSDLTLEADFTLFREIMRNILINAIKYCDTEIAIWAKVSKNDRLDNQKYLAISVKNDGDPIPQEHLKSLFDYFYRVDDSRSKVTGGAGIGLSIVKQAVELHGGEVDVISNKTQGTTFTCYFPISPRQFSMKDR